MMRPETGPMQFDDDWCGLFVRGDNAMYFAMIINGLLDGTLSLDDVITKSVIKGLANDLMSCIGNPADAQQLKKFSECVKNEDPKPGT